MSASTNSVSSTAGPRKKARRDDTAFSPTPVLLGLPVDAMNRILSFVGDPYEFLKLERTCQTFRRALKDDKVWTVPCYDYPFGQRTHLTPDPPRSDGFSRESFFQVIAIRRIRREQKHVGNIILECFAEGQEKNGADAVQSFVDHLIEIYEETRRESGNTSPYPKSEHKYFLRGDSLFVFTELLQEFFLTRLHKAQALAAYASKSRDIAYGSRADPQDGATIISKRSAFADDERPRQEHENLSSSPFRRASVTVMDLHMVDYVAGCTDSERLFLKRVVQFRCGDRPRNRSYNGRKSFDTAPEQYATILAKIVRRLAYRAGIAKMSGAAFDLLAGDIARLSILLLEPAITELCTFCYHDRRAPHNESDQEEQDGYESGDDVVDMYNMSPPAQEVVVQDSSGVASAAAAAAAPKERKRYVHVICPRQIESGALKLGIPCCKVHPNTAGNSGWVVTGNNNVEDERSEARAQYYAGPPSDPWFDDKSFSSFGSDSSFDDQTELAKEIEVKEEEKRREELEELLRRREEEELDMELFEEDLEETSAEED